MGNSGGDLAKGRGRYQLSAMFYLVVAEAVLLFDSYSWAILESTTRTLEVMRVGFLRKITGKREQITTNRTWETLVAVDVLWAAGLLTSASGR